MDNHHRTAQKALRHSATCFLNSLFREWSDAQVSYDPSLGQIEVGMTSGTLVLPLEQHSILGRHRFKGEFFLRTGKSLEEVSFATVVSLLCQHLAQTFETSAAQVAQFEQRVRSSVSIMQKSLTRFAETQTSGTLPLHFRSTEQALLIGHNFHPTPKSRDEFSDEDLRLYSPEMGGHFRLLWMMAHPSLLHQRTAAHFHDHDWTLHLARQESVLTDEALSLADEGMIPIPMHPWQVRQLERNPVIQGYLSKGLLRILPQLGPEWSPTSSLRSVYREDASYMLKFSMSVKLTNSVRHLLAHEVERGLQLYDVLATSKGKEFSHRHPRFHVIKEPAYFCFKSPAGELINESLVVCRENPFQQQSAIGKAVLATLAQESLLGGRNLIQSLIEDSEQFEQDVTSFQEKSQRWFSAYLDLVVEPLVLAHANEGIVLGAHQQNLVLDLENGFPVACYFRDCQGTGYTELGYSRYANEVSSINRQNGNVVSEKMGNSLFTYYLILNSTFNVITALTASGEITERELLTQLRTKLSQLRASGVRDSSCLDEMLDHETLLHKGNFLCAFQNINENTTEDPLSIYSAVANPLRDLLQAEVN